MRSDSNVCCIGSGALIVTSILLSSRLVRSAVAVQAACVLLLAATASIETYF